jgi:hypothetical protein
VSPKNDLHDRADKERRYDEHDQAPHVHRMTLSLLATNTTPAPGGRAADRPNYSHAQRARRASLPTSLRVLRGLGMEGEVHACLDGTGPISCSTSTRSSKSSSPRLGG